MATPRSLLAIYDRIMIRQKALTKVLTRRSTAFAHLPDSFGGWGVAGQLKYDDDQQWALELGEAIGMLEILSLNKDSELIARDTKQ